MDRLKARVLKSTGSWYQVELEDGSKMDCRLRGKFKNLELKVTNPIAVGDWVLIEPDDDGKGIISEIEPRRNYFIRKSVKKTDHAHLIAANIDQAILVVTLALPRTSLGFIDRFLVSIEAFRIPGVLLFNKADIMDEVMLTYQKELAELYQNLGYKCLLVSAETGEGMDEVSEILKGKLSVFSGHSGAGKSTLINRLIPSIQQKTAQVSSFANKGVHTTTFAEMFEVDSDTWVIDTPGIKELGLVEMEEWEISHYFPEMRHFLGQCKFNNCLHINEPNCKIIEALDSGQIAISRYNSYLSMLMNEESHR